MEINLTPEKVKQILDFEFEPFANWDVDNIEVIEDPYIENSWVVKAGESDHIVYFLITEDKMSIRAEMMKTCPLPDFGDNLDVELLNLIPEEIFPNADEWPPKFEELYNVTDCIINY